MGYTINVLAKNNYLWIKNLFNNKFIHVSNRLAINKPKLKRDHRLVNRDPSKACVDRSNPYYFTKAYL